MSKNTIIAFLIILITIQFFTSRFYYEKIIHKPYPEKSKRKHIKKESKEKEVSEKKQEKIVSKTDLIEKASKISDIVIKEELEDTTEILEFDTIWIETDKIICAISERGGRFISIKNKEFKYRNEKDIKESKYIELVNNSNKGGANLSINERSFDEEMFRYQGEKKKIVLKDEKKVSLNFIYNGTDNIKVKKEFTFIKDSYKIGYKIISDEISGEKVVVGWKCGIKESEVESGRGAQYNRKKIHFYGGGNSEHREGAKEEKIERTGDYNWVAISSKYFAVALIPEKIRDADIKVKCYYNQKEKEKGKKNNKEINISVSCTRFCDKNEEDFLIYAGPTKVGELKKLDIKLEKILFGVSSKIGKIFAKIFIGGEIWFPKLCEFVLWLLINLQKLLKDYGVVIIVLTIILRIVTYPLTQSSMKSMNKMKEIQPRINRIREKYKSNPKKMNMKIMEFYKEEGINPLGGMGGCLPMILQMPIMISLFIVLRKAIELRGKGTILIPWIKDLSQAEVLFPLGFNIPFYGSNVALLPIIMAVLMYFQNKATIKDPNQKAMIYMMPVLMLVMFNNFPSGLCLYFTFSTLLQFVQQKIMDRKKVTA